MATAKSKTDSKVNTDASKQTNPESDSPADATEGVETPKRSVADRVKDSETRWGKEIQEVMIELHDHVFGTSRPHEEVKAEREAAAKAAE